MTRTINFVEGYLGKVGVSFFANLLLEFALEYELDPLLVDLDNLNADVLARYKKECRIDTEIKLPSDMRFEALLNSVYESEKPAIVNIPAGGFEDAQAFAKNMIADEITEVNLRRWFISDGSQKSFEIFKLILETENTSEKVFVHNLRDGLVIPEAQKAELKASDLSMMKVSWIQFTESDLVLLKTSPNLPLSELSPLLSEQGRSRFELHKSRIFDHIFPIVFGK